MANQNRFEREKNEVFLLVRTSLLDAAVCHLELLHRPTGVRFANRDSFPCTTKLPFDTGIGGHVWPSLVVHLDSSLSG